MRDSGDFLGGCTRNATSSDNSNMFLNLMMMKLGKPNSNFKVENETEYKKEYCLENSQCQAYSYDNYWDRHLLDLEFGSK
jgi:hypothetical protein